ncbi:hypothetical protein NY2A_B792R [Paramecium bursaria Chlorella virus NY2A]|uniref:Uncharacterized protein B792R n=1 Tax=Paramecium bursaria Chlorella virus NY2A TaxID=46021 RepID=A7IXW7_PBCVN|nr:hypothetical protein NY2A_B792R [Paramecium bursaria Chlorella virus NY2A]ABT15191.1 hypothetical protein NY2A_B792R [Paramecium bursaria Chlorella virus NY2A]
MAFRSAIISHLETLVENIEKHNFKISSTMKAEFVEFLNNYAKYHLDMTDIEYKLTSNMLFAQADDIRVIVATDPFKEFKIPGSNVSMREKIEAFILVNEDVAYDSVLMRRFHKPSPSNEHENPPKAPQDFVKITQTQETMTSPATDHVPAPVPTHVPAPAAAPMPTPDITSSPVSVPTFLTTTTSPPAQMPEQKPMTAFNFNATPSTEPFKNIFPSTTPINNAFTAKPNAFSSFNLTRADSTASSSKW